MVHSTAHKPCVTFCFLKTQLTYSCHLIRDRTLPVTLQHVSPSGFAFNTPWWLAFLFRLEEGQYLIAHKAGEPFVTLLKAANGKVTRGAYNLQQVHSSVPGPPASGPVPWIPVDPAVVLPFHQKHGRVPCSFPVKPFVKVGAFFTATPTVSINNDHLYRLVCRKSAAFITHLNSNKESL